VDSIVVYHLAKLARFTVQVSAYNRVGEGVRSDAVVAGMTVLNCLHNEMKLKQNSSETVLKLFCFSFISLRGQFDAHTAIGTVSLSLSVRQKCSSHFKKALLRRLQGAAKKYPPKIFFAVFSAIAWMFKAKFYQHV